jgi:hypothetical protein
MKNLNHKEHEGHKELICLSLCLCVSVVNLS